MRISYSSSLAWAVLFTVVVVVVVGGIVVVVVVGGAVVVVVVAVGWCMLVVVVVIVTRGIAVAAAAAVVVGGTVVVGVVVAAAAVVVGGMVVVAAGIGAGIVSKFVISFSRKNFCDKQILRAPLISSQESSGARREAGTMRAWQVFCYPKVIRKQRPYQKMRAARVIFP